MGRAVKKKPVAKRTAAKKPTPKKPAKQPIRPVRWLLVWVRRVALVCFALLMLAVSAYVFIDPPTTIYMASENRRLDGVDHQWVDMNEISAVMARSVVAAEDANFCNHWGFDMAAIRDALEDGTGRGASTISQQVVKNTYLWQGRSWLRKALEAVITPAVEMVWTKRRILEVYLNVAEFGEGVFGVEAAAHTYFRVGPDQLTASQAARLAGVLPSPKKRSAARPTKSQAKRAQSIADGAATILADGRSACFES